MAQPAFACMRNAVGFSQIDKINNEFDYLICLHNEQNDALNRQANVIRSLAQAIDSKDTQIILMQQQLDRLQNRLLQVEVSRPRP